MKEEKKTHVGAYGLIIKDGSVALIKKARGGYTGLLDLPGGGIEHTESPEETLKRELMEEAGVEVTNYELIGVSSFNLKWPYKEKDIIEDLHHIGILYKVELKDYKLKKSPDGLDSNGCFFYEIDKLSSSEITPFTKMGLELLGYKIKD